MDNHQLRKKRQKEILQALLYLLYMTNVARIAGGDNKYLRQQNENGQQRSELEAKEWKNQKARTNLTKG